LETASREEVQNLALALVMMWGPSRRLPAEQRLMALVDGLDEHGAAALVEEARQAERLGNSYLWERSDAAGEQAHFAPQAQMEEAVMARFPWVDAANLDSLYSQSCYWVWHG